MTQFELLTAAAFWELAAAGVEVAVVEAGLGGRYDATSVIDARVTVLTNVGLEHTRWLGPTVATSPTRSSRCSPTARAGARPGPRRGGAGGRRAGGRRAGREMVVAGSSRAGPELRASGELPAAQLRARPRRRRGLPAARRARARASRRSRDAAARDRVPGRLQVLDERPARRCSTAPTTRTPSRRLRVAARAARRAPAGAGAGVLEDKDAAAMLARAAAALAAGLVHRARPASARSPAALESLARQLGFERGRVRAQPGARARGGAREWAREREAARCWSPARSTWSATCCGAATAGCEERAMNDDGPSVLRDDRRRGAVRGARDPGVLRCRLWLRPAVSLNSDASRCHRSPTSESKAAA